MSRELQDKADRVIRELKESLVPLTEAIRELKGKDDPGDN